MATLAYLVQVDQRVALVLLAHPVQRDR